MGVAMSHPVVKEEDKVTEEDQDMSDNVEQDVPNDEDSDQHCEVEVSLLMQCIDYTFLIKIMFCFAGRRTGCDI